MASGHLNRVKRPDTWLHRPMLRNVKKVLANPEPSTHDPNRTSVESRASFHFHQELVRPATNATIFSETEIVR